MLKFIRSLLGSVAAPRFVGRAFTRDSNTVFTYRMGAGFPGSVNRSHPASIEPTVMDPDAPVVAYGRVVVPSAANPNTMRMIAAGDGALTKVYGISVRPYPIQQMTGGLTADFGEAIPPVDQPLDVLTSGYIMARVNGTPNKGDPVYVWIAATDAGAGHYQGGFETAADGGNTILLANQLGNIEFNGPPDADGIGEIRFRI